jgi:glycosyl hydrolase family 16
MLSDREAVGLRVRIVALVLGVVLAVSSTVPARSGWEEGFSAGRLDSRFWEIGNGRAPGYLAGNHIGYYQPDHIGFASDAGGGRYLSLLLTQENGPVDSNPNGVISRGVLLQTRKVYGYGTYEWRMRMSSSAATPQGAGNAVSGSVSAGFVYANNSETEIDFEFSGRQPDTLFMVNWLNPKPALDPTPEGETLSTLQNVDVTGVFRVYKFVWEPGRITLYIDGSQIAVHTTDVPSTPAHFMINHWGTNSMNWGGMATVGRPRYFYVDWVRFTPR